MEYSGQYIIIYLIKARCCEVVEGLLLRKILTGVCSPGFATIPLAMETEGQNHTLGYGKWVKIKPMTTGNITKLTTFEAILHDIGQMWPKFCHLLRKNAGIRSKWLKFPENIPLATEPRPKLDPWIRKSSQNIPLATEVSQK